MTLLGVPRARSIARSALLRGAAVECAWTALHAAAYPLGVVQERTRPARDGLRMDALPPHQRGRVLADPAASGVPVLLLHGVIDNRMIFARLRRTLRRSGLRDVRTLNYTPLLADVRVAAELLAARVEQVCAETGYDQIHLVGHSLGGIIARYYVQRLGGDARVGTVVMLGSPHQGTVLARALPALVLRQLRPGSPLLVELGAAAPHCRSRFVNVWSTGDQLVLPREHGRLEHDDLEVRDVRVQHVGHMSLTVDRRVLSLVADELAHAPEPRQEPAALSLAGPRHRLGSEPALRSALS